ncbi:MAG: hypothetical protein ABIJ56_08345 [Pseudomonadota bacterium]
MRAMMIALCLVFAAACGDDAASVNPMSGMWIFVGGDIFNDSCNYTDSPVDPDGEFSVTNNGNNTLTIDTGGDEMFQCTLSGANFNCPERKEVDIEIPLVDAVFHVNVSAEGSFQSDTSASGHETANITCTGADCEAAAATAGITIPCSYSQYFAANHSG